MKFLHSVFSTLLLFSMNAAAVQRNSDEVKINKLFTSLEKSDFRISAKIYYGNEDEIEIPVNSEFHLLDKSLIAILKEANFSQVDEGEECIEKNKNKISLKDEDYLKALADLLFAEQYDEEESGVLNFLFWESVNKHKI